MRNYILLPILCLSCFLFSGLAHGQLRVVTYNTNTFGTEVGGSNIRTVRDDAEIVIEAIGEEVVNGIARPADIILLQEQQQPDTTTQDFLNRINTIYQAQGITYARGFEVGNTTSGNGLGTPSPGEIRQGVIYRTDTVELISEDSFGDLSGGLISQPRETLLHQFRPIGFSSDADLYIFNSHFEAGDSDEDMAGRETEADQIRQFIDDNNLGNSNVIVAGDLNVSDNFMTSSATGFGNLSALEILSADGDGRVLDPLFPNGEMVNFSILDFGVPNSPFGVDLAPLLTQSPSDGAGPLVGGGIDDRFDFILQSDELLDGNGVASIPDSLRAFGNNGSTLNTEINDGNTITINGLTSFSTSQVLDALESTSDHLPVVEDFQLPATLSAELNPILPLEIGLNDAVTVELLISNATNVENILGADTLQFMVFTSGDVAGSFTGSDQALDGGVSVTLALDTSELGVRSGVITVTSNGEGAVLNGSTQFEVSFLVGPAGIPQTSVELTGVFSAQVEEDEIDAFGTEVDTAFFNVQGDDDAFTVYSLVDFDTSSIGQVSAINSLSLELAQSNTFFSANGGLEFFLASDTRAVDLTDTARFISDQANGGANTGEAVVGNSFGVLFPLGNGTFNATATGDVDTVLFSLDAAGEAFAISQINSGGLLRIIATPADADVQATYSGAGSILAPPSPPVLNLNATPNVLIGDINLDGVVDFFDISPFIELLSASDFQAEADIDGNGVVDFFDISPFIDILSNQ